MKKVFLLACLLLSVVMTFGQETKRVAILETVDKQGNVSYANKLILRSNLAKAVTNTPGYEAYDRTDMDAIMGEQDFQRTGMVSNDQIKRLGEMTGAKYVLVAEAVIVDDHNMYITAKLLDVETARTEMTDNQMMGTSAREIQRGCQLLAEKLIKPIVTSKTVVIAKPEKTKTEKTTKEENNPVKNEKPIVKEEKTIKEKKPVIVKEKKNIPAKHISLEKTGCPIFLGLNGSIGGSDNFKASYFPDTTISSNYGLVGGIGLDFAYPLSNKLALGLYFNAEFSYEITNDFFLCGAKFGILMLIGDIEDKPFILGIAPSTGIKYWRSYNDILLPFEVRFGRVINNNFYITGNFIYGNDFRGKWPHGSEQIIELSVSLGYHFGDRFRAK